MTATTGPVRFRCIVAAVDFSPESERALAWAERLAVARGAELRLVHALAWDEAPDVVAVFDRSMLEDLIADARNRLSALAAGLRERRVRSVDYEVKLGPAPRVILEEAAAHHAELVVVGTRGLRGWRHLVLGSTAERVISRASCPVLAVHGADAMPPERPWRLLAATDGSPEAAQAVRAAALLFAPEGAAEIVLLRAFEPPPVFYPAGGELAIYQVAAGARGLAVERLMQEARALAAEGIEVRPLLRDGLAPEVIVDAVVELRADLVVLGSRGLGAVAQALLGSTAERVAQCAAAPVLVVPRRAGPALEEADEALALVGAPVDQEC
jgi:nucleotide-binding universal stress UspA family protein